MALPPRSIPPSSLTDDRRVQLLPVTDYAFAETANTANTALTANNADHAYGKAESGLNVNSAAIAISCNTANTANTANNADSAVIAQTANTANTATSATTALTANNADHAFGKNENQLNVNSAASLTNPFYDGYKALVGATGYPLRRQASIHVITNALNTPTVANVGCTFFSGGTLASDNVEITPFQDHIGFSTDGSWITLQAAATLQANAFLSMNANPGDTLERNFDSFFEIQTPASLTDLILWVGFSIIQPPLVGHPGNNAMVMLRYLNSTTDALANDAGWTIVLQSDSTGGNNQFTYPLGSIAASTKYLIRIQSNFNGMSGGGSPIPVGNVTFTLNGNAHSVDFGDTLIGGSYPTNYAMPTGSHQTNRLHPMVAVVQKHATSGASIRKLSVRRFVVTGD